MTVHGINSRALICAQGISTSTAQTFTTNLPVATPDQVNDYLNFVNTRSTFYHSSFDVVSCHPALGADGCSKTLSSVLLVDKKSDLLKDRIGQQASLIIPCFVDTPTFLANRKLFISYLNFVLSK